MLSKTSLLTSASKTIPAYFILNFISSWMIRVALFISAVLSQGTVEGLSLPIYHILIRMLFFACGILITTSCPVRAFIPLWSLVNQFTSSGLFSAVDSMFAFMIELTVSFGTLSSISAIMIELTVSFGTLSSILAIFDSRLLACGVLRIIDVSAIRVN